MENDHHNLAFPIKQFETATPYVSNLLRYCGLGSPKDLCLDQGFRGRASSVEVTSFLRSLQASVVRQLRI